MIYPKLKSGKSKFLLSFIKKKKKNSFFQLRKRFTLAIGNRVKDLSLTVVSGRNVHRSCSEISLISIISTSRLIMDSNFQYIHDKF